MGYAANIENTAAMGGRASFVSSTSVAAAVCVKLSDTRTGPTTMGTAVGALYVGHLPPGLWTLPYVSDDVRYTAGWRISNEELTDGVLGPGSER